VQYTEVQRVLRDEIVNPLRQQLFVRADKVMALRTLLDTLSNVSGLTDQEKDPEEFLNSLFNQVGLSGVRRIRRTFLTRYSIW
jgi:ubiquitin carboxyl-terminal hydrolase CYLD